MGELIRFSPASQENAQPIRPFSPMRPTTLRLPAPPLLDALPASTCSGSSAGRSCLRARQGINNRYVTAVTDNLSKHVKWEGIPLA